MSRRVRVEHTYKVDADRLWGSCVSYSCLAETMASLASYDGLPDGELIEGQRVEVRITHHKIIAPLDWVIEVTERDDTRRVLRTTESGGAIRSYLHPLSVDDLGDGVSRLVDDIVFDAGWQTLPMSLWIRHVYKARDKPRRKILGLPT